MSSIVRMGWDGRVGFAESNPVSPPTAPTESLEILSDGVVDEQIREDASGITGVYSAPADRMIEMARRCGGTILFEPRPLNLLSWLPRIMGAAAGSITAGVTPFTLGYNAYKVDHFAKRGDGVAIFRECEVASAVFEAQEGGRFRANLNMLGKDRDADINTSFSWPSGAAGQYERATAWRFADCTLTIGGQPFKFYRFALSIDNLLSPRMMSGSLAPTEYPRAGRRVMLGLSTPWGNGLPLHETLRTSSVSATIRLTYGTGPTERYVEFVMPNLIPPVARTPIHPGRDEIRYDVELQACATTTSGNMVDGSELTASVKSAGS